MGDGGVQRDVAKPPPLNVVAERLAEGFIAHIVQPAEHAQPDERGHRDGRALPIRGQCGAKGTRIARSFRRSSGTPGSGTAPSPAPIPYAGCRDLGPGTFSGATI